MANPKLATLVDFFGAGAINTTVWNNSSGSPDVTLDTTLDRVAIACQSYYPIFSALGPFDATGSTLYARITPAPVGNGSTQTIMRFALDGSNRVTMYLDGGQILTARVTNASVDTTTVIGPYDPYQHRWWRLRESGGTVNYETAPDGYTWTTRATMTPTWAMTAVQAVFLCGFYGTESAGMAAYVDHVGTTTSAQGQPNLNWPGIEACWAPYWNCNGGDLPLDRYIEVTPSTRGKTSIQRGRQYELDQVRSGELMTEIVNKDGSLDPNNVSGPWYGHLQPYQPYRVRAQWPPTRNMLTQVIATGGDLGGYSTGTIPSGATGIDVFTSTDSSGGQIAADATAWQASRVFAMSVPSGTASNTPIWYTLQNGVIPGTTYTATFHIRNVTASTTLQADAYFDWFVPAGVTKPAAVRSSAQTLTGSTTAAWTTVTVTATAPAGVAGMVIGVETSASPAATCTLQVDGVQLEKASSATTWVCPGVTYPMYGGFVERWPSQWSMNGTYGTVQPTAVDALSLLSQVQLKDPLSEEIQLRNPRFLYTLGDPSGSTSFTDSTGHFPAAPVTSGKYGAGTLTAGNSITSQTSGGTYTGSSNTVVTVANANPGTNLIGGASFISLSSAGVKGPATPTSFTRMIAFRYTGATPTSGNWATIWVAMDNQRNGGFASGSQISFNISNSGNFYITLGGPSNNQTAYNPGVSVTDKNWHLVGVSYNDSTGIVWVTVDGGSWFWSGVTGHAPSGCVSDTIGNWVDATVGNGTSWNYAGDLSYAVEFPTALGQNDFTAIYNAWKTSCSGESTNARYNRIISYAGYTGVWNVQAGLTTSMGPAAFTGQDALSALQSVVDTENGEHFVARDGTLTFRSRSARYNTLTPAVIFGENAAAGEIPYEDCQLDYDPTHLSNLVTITQASTNQLFTAQDATSQTNYFPRSLTRTVNSSSALECQDAAGYLLSRYKNALTRVQALKLHPSANPALWPTLLNLELGTRVRVMRRPPSPAPAIQVECFVEAIQWDWDDQGEAFVTLQCSPADLNLYALFAAFHTTLSGSPAAGVTTITINAGSDNQNPAAAQLGQGQQLVLGLGTANQETVTILSVGTTSAGWTTATITLQAATTKSHTNGDTVCEPLPTGVTSPTTWDNSAKFDSVYFAY
ncbi:hypothetical protein ABZX95_17015 [Streptomyces sp. NPDC004232]|uniref:hypothetical protein n=1 Tax=Streptomyces sp. NPDC004232 TaxID=3154454 RepID=UPI0033BAE26A